MENTVLNNTERAIKRRVYIETNDYVIRGVISVEKGVKDNRILTCALNSDKEFIAVENCSIQSRKFSSQQEITNEDFIEINKSSILLMKPLAE